MQLLKVVCGCLLLLGCTDLEPDLTRGQQRSLGRVPPDEDLPVIRMCTATATCNGSSYPNVNGTVGEITSACEGQPGVCGAYSAGSNFYGESCDGLTNGASVEFSIPCGIEDAAEAVSEPE